MTQVISSSAHGSGTTCLAFSRDGSIIYTGGQDCVVRLWKSEEGADQEPDLAIEADSGVSSVSTGPDWWLSGSEDSFVRQYQSGTTSFINNVTSANAVPIRCVAIDPAGKRVAVASDELSVKLVNLEDMSKVQFLQGHTRGVRRITWHPSLPLLTTSGADGNIIVWDVSGEEPTLSKTIGGVIPQVIDPDQKGFNFDCSAVWHPSGDYFVVTTRTHDIVTISKSSWQKTSSYTDEKVTGETTALAMSANGIYLASASKGSIHVWSTQTRHLLLSHPLSTQSESIVTHLAFCPSRNIIAWTDTSGALTRWIKAIPASHPDPVKMSRTGAALMSVGKRAVDSLFNDEAEVDGAREPEDVDLDADIVGEVEDDWIIDDVGDGMKDNPVVSKRSGIKEMVSITQAQPPFQPGATPMENKKCYLAHNMLGVIEVTDQDTHNVVNVEVFDKTARKGFHFTDHYKYNLGYLGERGAVFACQPESDHPAQVLYRPFSSWNSQIEWTYPLSRTDTKILGVACGGSPSSVGKQTADGDLHGFGNVVVATSENDLTFLSGTGRERRILGLGADYVTMVASVEWVFVVHRAGSTTIDGSQNLSYSLINFEDFSVRQRDILPLPKGSMLKWVGISEEGAPVIYDSTGYLHVLTKYRVPHHASWARILDANMLERRQGKDESYWPVGLVGSTFMCLILKGRQEYPGFPRPLVQEVPVRMPFRREDAALERIEREALLLDMARDSLGEELTTSAIVQREVAMDKEFIQLIQIACKAGNIHRSIELAKLLHHTKSFDAAIKIADFYSLVGLKEKLQVLKEDREENEEERLAAARDKRVSWSRTDRPLRQLQPESSRQAASQKPFQDFGPPPAVRRPGLTPATPAVQMTRYSSATPSQPPPSVSTAPDNKRKREEEYESSGTPMDTEFAMPAPKKSNPFARKADNGNKNPFARKSQTEPIQKSESFFQKVDAAESGATKSKKASIKGKEKKEGPKQATLFGMMKRPASQSESQSTDVEETRSESLVETQLDEPEETQVDESGRFSPDWSMEGEEGVETQVVGETQLLEAKF